MSANSDRLARALSDLAAFSSELGKGYSPARIIGAQEVMKALISATDAAMSDIAGDGNSHESEFVVLAVRYNAAKSKILFEYMNIVADIVADG